MADVAKGKDWLPEVGEPLGMTNTEFFVEDEAGDVHAARLQPSGEHTGIDPRFKPEIDELLGREPREGVWLTVGGDRYFVEDEHLAYALAGARKARTLGGPTRFADYREAGR